MQRKKVIIFLLSIALLLLEGCDAPLGRGRPAYIPALDKKKGPVNAMRAEALKEMAMSGGSQGGLARRAEKINYMLKKEEARLFEVFNFNAMLLRHNVLPPVLEQGLYALHQDNDET